MAKLRALVTMLLTVFSLQVVLISCASAGQSQWSVNDFQIVFDSLLEQKSAELDSTAASGRGLTYYYFSYALDGILGMYEGTRDPKYVEQALQWGETMVSKATIIDSDGRRNWSGPWASPYSATPISHHLYDLQGSTQLARLARIVLADPSLKARYGHRATPIYRFVKHDISDKWLYPRNATSWYRYNATNTTRGYNDQIALASSILINLYQIDRDPVHFSLASDLVEAFIRRMRPYQGGALLWDDGTLDTSHANRMPYMIVMAYEAGLVATRTDVNGLSRLLTDVIWDRSMTSPRFTNFIDGSNAEAYGRPPYGVGQIFSGWIALGAHDARVQAVGEAVATALLSDVRNPSLDYMASVYGKMCLLGHLVRNRAKLTEN